MNIKNNLTVLIGSCDAYSSIWKPFQICFDRYWKFDTKNYIVTEKLEVPNYTNTELITIKSEKSTWAKRMLDGISVANTEFIFFILEDYFFHYPYSYEKMSNWLMDMDKFEINRLQISPSEFQLYEEIENTPYHKLKTKSNYLISMQPSLWRKSFLMNVLKEEYSPWDFELKGSSLLKNKEHGIFIDRDIPNVYFNAIRKGFKKSKGWDEFIKKEGLE